MRIESWTSVALIALLAGTAPATGCVVKSGSADAGRPPASPGADPGGAMGDDGGDETGEKPPRQPVADPSDDVAAPPTDGDTQGPAPIDALRALNQAINTENAAELEALIHPEWGVTTGDQRFTRDDLGTKRLEGLPPKGHRMPERCPEAYTEGEATCTVGDRDGTMEIRFRLDGDTAYLVEITKK